MRSRYILLHDSLGWRVACVGDRQVQIQSVSEKQPATEAILRALQKLGYDGRRVCLALGSQLVVSAEIDTASLPRSHRRAAMLFRLEEQLPVDIETLTADFLPPTAGRTMGVAVATKHIKELVGPLSDVGVKVGAICPFALLALWKTLHQRQAFDYAILADRSSVEVFRLHDNQPLAWYSPGQQPRDIIRCLRADQLSRPLEKPQATVLLLDPQENLEKALADEQGLCLIRGSVSTAETAALGGAALLSGESAGWIDLRRWVHSSQGPLGHVDRLAQTAIVAAAVIFLLLAGSFLWRGLGYGQLAESFRQEAEKVYCQLYELPEDSQIYFSVRHRLLSDRQRLSGMSGLGTQLPVRLNALETLRQIVSCLPADIRFRIFELRLSPTEIFIEGQTRTHGQSEAICASLTGAGLHVDPPRTEQIHGGRVAFWIAGKPVLDAGAGQSGTQP